MIRAHRSLFRSPQLASLAAALAALAGCAAPDASNFSCSSSAECPSGYHCNLGTASTAGTFKCASGAPQQKTLSVDATRFLLARRPDPDGTVRTTLSAGMGGVSSTPDFVGVRVIAKLDASDVAQSTVMDDGSVLQFQIPDVNGALSFRVQDDSGHSVAVTGYSQQVVMSFAGKTATGTANPIQAYDAATATDSLFNPALWSGSLSELPLTSPVTNDVVSPAAYNGLTGFDGVSSITAAAPQPTATVLGWEQLAFAPTATSNGVQPSGRSGAAIAQVFNTFIVAGQSYNYVVYGGVDAAGVPADATPTVRAFSPDSLGWATVPLNVSTTTSPFPTRFFNSSFGVDNPIVRANAAIAPTFSFSPGTPGATNLDYNFFMAGGTDAAGNLTNKIYAYGDRITTSNGNKYSGWWDESLEFGAGARLAQPNANMAYAQSFIPVSAGTGTAPFFYAGMVLVGGRGNSAGAVNDASGCQYVTATSFSANAAPSFQASSCTADPSTLNLGNQWLTTTGGIGFRTGAALAPTDNFNDGATVYLFGGARSGATAAGQNGLQNDLWKGTIAVVCSPANVNNAPPPCTAASPTVSTQITWAQVQIAAASAKPSPRSGAAIAFGESRKLVLYGGTDATGARQDVWELDLNGASPFTWRQLTLDPAPALAPGARTNGMLIGASVLTGNFFDNNQATFLFGGATSLGPTSDVWVLSRQSAGRLLVKAPAGLTNPDLATNMTMSIQLLTPPFVGAPMYIWNGSSSSWDFLSSQVFGAGFISLPDPIGYLQPDGSFYFLFNSSSRSTPTNNNTANLVSLDGLEVTLDFQ